MNVARDGVEAMDYLRRTVVDNPAGGEGSAGAADPGGAPGLPFRRPTPKTEDIRATGPFKNNPVGEPL